MVDSACEYGHAAIANLNCPGQIVLSGNAGALDWLARNAKDIGATRTVRLKVSGAFHSALLESARLGMETFLKGVAIEKPHAIFIANVTGGALDDPDVIRENLVRQVTSPVRWVDSMRTIIDLGAERLIEVGPGNVLRGLMRKIDVSVPTAGAGRLDEIGKLTDG